MSSSSVFFIYERMTSCMHSEGMVYVIARSYLLGPLSHSLEIYFNCCEQRGNKSLRMDDVSFMHFKAFCYSHQLYFSDFYTPKCKLQHVRENITLLWTHYETTMGQYWGQFDDRSCWGKASSWKAENIFHSQYFVLWDLVAIWLRRRLSTGGSRVRIPL